MIQNVNPQRMYVLPNGVPPVQDYPVQVPVQYVAPYQVAQPNQAPVYNSIPYSSVYGNAGQVQQCQRPIQYSPKFSTVSIEMNGLEPPKVPGFNDMQSQTPQYYPSAAQFLPMTNQVPQYQNMQQVMPQAVPQYIPEQVPSYQAPVGMQPVPATIPQASTVGAIPPAPQYAPQPKQEPVVPQAAVDQVTAPVKPAVPQANPQQDQEAIKPLLESLSVIYPKPGSPEVPLDQQSKAIQTIAQFARAAEAAGQLSKTDPTNPEVKQTKEKVDSLIKPNLIKEETFLGLADIALKDTSKLAGEDKKKADENRIISMWTLAMLQKVFKQEMNDEAAKIKIPPISMNEVPGITQVIGLVVGDKENNIKPDANPEVREAGIAALVNLAEAKDPKDVETMRAVLTEAQADSAPNVKAAATEAIKAYPEPAKV